MVALERVGFRVLRIKAAITSCATKMAGARLCPGYSGETIGSGLLHKILRDCQLIADQFG